MQQVHNRRWFVFIAVVLGSAAGVVFGSGFNGRAQAQIEDNPVYVSDSPEGWELFQRAQDQAADNPTEAARVYQQLLDGFALRLLPRSEFDRDHLLSVRERVHAALRGAPVVFERYRLMQTAEAERLLAAGDHDRLLRTRFLTAPALEAVLRRTQEDIESARFRRAINRLLEAERHPDLSGRREAFYWYMLALASHHANDAAHRARGVERLGRMDDPAARALIVELNRLLAEAARPDADPVYVPNAIGPAADFTALHAQPIWSLALDASLMRRLYAAESAGIVPRSSAVQSARRDAGLMTTMPTLVGTVVYVNEGHRIRAIDRFSQRVLWSQVIGRGDGVPSPGDANTASDTNVIAIEGDFLVTLTGHAHLSSRSGRGELVCLDRRTGEVHWRIELDMLHGREEFERLFAHGALIAADGAVFVLASKPTREFLSSCYVLSFDLETGALRWSRYLAASSAMQREDIRSITSVTYDKGDLFIATPLGITASLAAESGEVRWLRRHRIPIVTAPRARVPWEISAPVMSPRGVVAISPDQRHVVLLDRETGEELERHSMTSFGSPRYLLADAHHVYSIGQTVYAYDHEELTAPIWVLDHGRAAEMRGRVQVVEGGLIVPTTSAILHIDAESGAELGRLAVDGGGNVLAVGPQLFLASTDELRSFMALEVAEAMLRERIDAAPNDAEPALSLLRLSLRAGNAAMGLDAALAVRRVLDRLPADDAARVLAQRELFEQLIAFDASDVQRTIAEGDAIHDQLESMVERPTQRVRQMLARGDWLARSAAREPGRLILAGGMFDAVLADEALATIMYSAGDVDREARLAATQRLGRLVARHGPEFIRSINPDAEARLSRIAGAAASSPEAIVEQVMRSPFAAEANNATIEAARRFRDRGDRHAAVSLLSMRARLEGVAERERLYGLLIETCLEAGWDRLATAYLEEADRAGLTSVTATGGSRLVRPWIQALRAGDGRWQPLPVLGDFHDETGGRRLAGRLLVATAVGARQPIDRAYLLDGQMLRAHAAEDLEELWSLEMPTMRASILTERDGRVLFWSESDVRRLVEPALIVVDSATGTKAWEASNLLTRLLGTRDEDLRAPLRDEALPSGRVFDPRDVIPVVDGRRLYAVGRVAGIAAFDVQHGAEPVWLTDHGLTHVYHAAAHDLAVVLSGIVERRSARTGRIERKPLIVLMDPLTGAIRREITPRDEQVVRWMTVLEDGRLVTGGNSVVEVFSLASGDREWTNLSDEAPDMARAWEVGGRLLVQDASASLRGMSLEDGRFGPAPILPGGDWSPSDLLGVIDGGSGRVALYRDRVLFFDEQGRLSGRDSIVEDRLYTHVAAAADRVIVVSHVRRRGGGIPEPGQRRSLFVDRLYVLSRNGMVIDGRDVEAESPPASAVGVVNGWVLISSETQTIAAPAPLVPVDAGGDEGKMGDDPG